MDSLMDVSLPLRVHGRFQKMQSTYTFDLREDVYFHTHYLFGTNQTRTVTANDFVYSFDRLRDPKLASPGGWVLQNVESYKALDAQRFQITLKSPFPCVFRTHNDEVLQCSAQRDCGALRGGFQVESHWNRSL